MEITADLYEYNTIKNDRLFGINGIINPSLSQEYREANENFVNYINNISNINVQQYQYTEYVSLLNININTQKSPDYYIKVEVDENCNKLNINKLNMLIMNKSILLYNNYYNKNTQNIVFGKYII